MADKLTFYTNPMSRGRIIRWMLEEVGQPYETEILGYGTSMKGPEYLALNPMGKVPAIRHGNAVVTEGAAICAYLADVFPQANAPPPTTKSAPVIIVGCSSPPARSRRPATKAMGWEAPADKQGMLGFGSMAHVLDALEFALKDTQYIAGDRFTAADVYFGSHIMWGVQFGTLEKRAAFDPYMARLPVAPPLSAHARSTTPSSPQQKGKLTAQPSEIASALTGLDESSQPGTIRAPMRRRYSIPKNERLFPCGKTCATELGFRAWRRPNTRAEWAVVVLGAVLLAVGIVLTLGGVRLATVGGSWFYALAGVLLIAAGVAYHAAARDRRVDLRLRHSC